MSAKTLKVASDASKEAVIELLATERLFLRPVGVERPGRKRIAQAWQIVRAELKKGTTRTRLLASGLVVELPGDSKEVRDGKAN